MRRCSVSIADGRIVGQLPFDLALVGELRRDGVVRFAVGVDVIGVRPGTEVQGD
jgi:hypothetical protein